MVKRKRLAKRFLVVALTLCMIAASTQKPMTVRAEENVTTTETDSEDTDTNDGNQKETTESNSTIEEDTTGKDTDENGEAAAANLDEDAASAEQNGVTSGSDSDEDAGDSGDDTGDSGEDADGDASAEDASAGTAASGSETEDESSDDDSAAAENGILLASEEEEETAVSTLSATSTVSLAEPEIDKTATSLDENNQTTVTLTIGAGSGVENVAVLFVLDYSTSVNVRNAAGNFLTELASKTNTNVKAAVVDYSAVAAATEWTTIDENTDTSGDGDGLLASKTNSGTNYHAGLLKAQELLKSSEIEGYTTYLITISDGITYLWTDDDASSDTYEQTMSVYVSNGEGGNHNSNSVYEIKYGSGNKISDDWFKQLTEGTSDTFLSAYNKTLEIAVPWGTVYSDSVASIAKSDVADYLIGTEVAIYKTASVYNELLKSVDYAFAFKMDENNWTSFPYGEQLMDYLIGVSATGSGTISNTTAGNVFESIKDQIIYEIATGSITDVIGADFTLTDAGTITADTFSLTVNGTKLEVTGVNGNVVTFENNFVLTYYQGTTTSNGDGMYTITATDASGKTVTYTPCDTSDEVNGSVSDEFFILTFGTAVVSLELTYNLTLTSLKTADGTYTVPTNETAVLDYTPTQGTKNSMEFPEPTVVYVVTSETETTDPTPDTSTETETETTEPTEVVSAATGDSTPLELSVFIAVISGFTLLFQWQALKRKKSFQEKG